MARIDLRNCTIKLIDGGSNELEINIGEGDLTWDEARTVEYVKNRGVLSTVRLGADVPVDVKCEAVFAFVTGNASDLEGAITPRDAMLKTGGAASWATTGSDACEPYAIDITVLNDPSCGSVDNELVTFSEFRVESVDFDIKRGTLVFNGKCKAVEATAERDV